MKDLFSLAGITRQGHFQELDQVKARDSLTAQCIDLAMDMRKEHPAIGCRKIYYALENQIPTGRDNFEQLLLKQGFRVRQPKNYTRTTYSIKNNYFSNIISGKEVTGINQVWQSDITYFALNGNFYYLVFIIDVFSKRIVGYNACENLMATSNIKALKKALKLRQIKWYKNLIHHSDRGVQYIFKDYIQLLEEHNIQPSMCINGWENAYAERVNGIIKNEYLHYWGVENYKQLRKYLEQAVKRYNSTRPHLYLPGKLSPIEYERRLKTGQVKPHIEKVYDSVQAG